MHELPPDDTGILPPAEDTAAHEAVAPERAPMPPPGPPVPAPGPPRGWLAVENPWPWLLLVLVVVAGLLVWLLLIRGNGMKHAVPRVVGLRQRDATARLTRAGYDVAVVRAASRKQPAGIVFAQAPGAGSRLARGQTVTVDVANGARLRPRPKPVALPTTAATTATTSASVAVPDVTGQAQAAAGGAVEAAGLVPDSFPVPSSRPSGAVLSESPAAGTTLGAGASVRLNVSAGRGNQPAVQVPDVTGRTAAEARAALWAAKLTVRTVYAHASTPAQIGHVVGQTGSGSSLPAFSQVTITVAR